MAVSGSTGLSFACGYNWEVYVVIGVSDTGNSQRMIEYKFSKLWQTTDRDNLPEEVYNSSRIWGDLIPG